MFFGAGGLGTGRAGDGAGWGRGGLGTGGLGTGGLGTERSFFDLSVPSPKKVSSLPGLSLSLDHENRAHHGD